MIIPMVKESYNTLTVMAATTTTATTTTTTTTTTTGITYSQGGKRDIEAGLQPSTQRATSNPG